MLRDSGLLQSWISAGMVPRMVEMCRLSTSRSTSSTPSIRSVQCELHLKLHPFYLWSSHLLFQVLWLEVVHLDRQSNTSNPSSLPHRAGGALPAGSICAVSYSSQPRPLTRVLYHVQLKIKGEADWAVRGQEEKRDLWRFGSKSYGNGRSSVCFHRKHHKTWP
jgi:hypothetical protein